MCAECCHATSPSTSEPEPLIRRIINPNLESCSGKSPKPRIVGPLNSLPTITPNRVSHARFRKKPESATSRFRKKPESATSRVQVPTPKGGCGLQFEPITCDSWDGSPMNVTTVRSNVKGMMSGDAMTRALSNRWFDLNQQLFKSRRCLCRPCVQVKG